MSLNEHDIDNYCYKISCLLLQNLISCDFSRKIVKWANKKTVCFLTWFMV